MSLGKFADGKEEEEEEVPVAAGLLTDCSNGIGEKSIGGGGESGLCSVASREDVDVKEEGIFKLKG